MPEHENNYTVVEVIDEKTQHGPITVTGARVNGQPVRVAARGVEVGYDIPGEGEDSASFVMVTLTLLVDEFHIHRVPEPRNSAEHKITDHPPVD